jgi:hypothetical protein
MSFFHIFLGLSSWLFKRFTHQNSVCTPYLSHHSHMQGLTHPPKFHCPDNAMKLLIAQYPTLPTTSILLMSTYCPSTPCFQTLVIYILPLVYETTFHTAACKQLAKSLFYKLLAHTLVNRQFIYLLTPWCRLLFEDLIVTQLVKQ